TTAGLRKIKLFTSVPTRIVDVCMAMAVRMLVASKNGARGKSGSLMASQFQRTSNPSSSAIFQRRLSSSSAWSAYWYAQNRIRRIAPPRLASGRAAYPPLPRVAGTHPYGRGFDAERLVAFRRSAEMGLLTEQKGCQPLAVDLRGIEPL